MLIARTSLFWFEELPYKPCVEYTSKIEAIWLYVHGLLMQLFTSSHVASITGMNITHGFDMPSCVSKLDLWQYSFMADLILTAVGE